VAKVLLLDSPSWRLFNPKLHCHLGILYLAGSLRAAGHDVKVVDCHRVTGWDGEHLEIKKDLLEPCDVLGLSATTANVEWGRQLAAAWPAKVKVLGGPHVTHIMEGPHERFRQRKYFTPFDFVMYGECEESFVAFVSLCGRGGDPRSSFIPGLVWWDDLGRHQSPAPALPDVTRLPGPAFDLWEAGFERGALSSTSAHGKEFDANNLMTASMYTARGCPYGCTFCADARTKLREETIEQIEKEAQQLATLGVQAVRLQDDTFTIKGDRCRTISDALSESGMHWRACTRVNLRDASLFRYMADKGCTELGFGIEHGSARMLKAMNKGTTPEANEIGVKMCQDAGIIARAFLLLGFPGETEESIDELEKWVLRVRPSSVTVSLFQPFPGSDVWNRPQNYGVELPDNAFDKFWQLGGDGDPEMMVLKLPSISRERLFYHRQRLVKIFEEEIGKLDRTQVHGNVGTFGPMEQVTA
jgi:radical SAM superfamily enzyme YgiQ (UPF0313 family)